MPTDQPASTRSLFSFQCTIQTAPVLSIHPIAKLRRKLPHQKGWARVVETKTADNPALENVHLHFVMLFPPGWAADVDATD
jgi:hypothetical protein